MKKFTGKAKVKEDTTWIYSGSTLDIIGYMEHRDGSGMGVYADGSREYRLSLVGTMFEMVYGKSTVIPCTHLDILELNEEIIMPLTESESLDLINYVDSVNKISPNVHATNKEFLAEFLEKSKKPSKLGELDLSTIYTEEEWNLRIQENS